MLHMYANGAIYSIYRNLNIQNGIAAKALQRLSSGKRINSAADDAAGLAISQKMKMQITSMRQQIRNNKDEISMLNTAEGAMSETHAILQRMKELTVQASNASYTDADRALLDKEYQALIESIDHIYNSTDYNGIKVLKEENGIVKEQPLSENGENGEDNGKTLRNTNILTQEAAQEANVMVTKIIDTVSMSRAGIGARINVLDHSISYLENAALNAEDALSTIEDADMALEMMKLTKANILINVNQALMAQAMNATEGMVRMLTQM